MCRTIISILILDVLKIHYYLETKRTQDANWFVNHRLVIEALENSIALIGSSPKLIEREYGSVLSILCGLTRGLGEAMSWGGRTLRTLGEAMSWGGRTLRTLGEAA